MVWLMIKAKNKMTNIRVHYALTAISHPTDRAETQQISLE